MADLTTAAELDRVLNLEGKAIEVAGDSLTIKPFRVRQLSAVLRCVDELSDKGVFEHSDAEGVTVREFSFAKMLLRGGDSMLEILSIATGKDIAWLGECDPLEAIRLCRVVFEVNADFFTLNQPALVEALGPLWGLVEAKMARYGLGLSSASSAEGTGSQTSQSTPSRKSKTSAGR